MGPTGAGKTTLVNLLMRFYEIDAGRILVDGVDTRELTRDDLRRTFGMVLQDTWLFHGTIRENIAYGREAATEEELIAAAEAAHVDHFVRTLPDGYETVIDDDATNVSAGEKQLLTIARAFLADPSILILDEATSSVDTRTEVLIQRAMERLMHGRTAFVIAHRLSTIRDAHTSWSWTTATSSSKAPTRSCSSAAASTVSSTRASSRSPSPRRSRRHRSAAPVQRGVSVRTRRVAAQRESICAIRSRTMRSTIAAGTGCSGVKSQRSLGRGEVRQVVAVGLDQRRAHREQRTVLLEGRVRDQRATVIAKSRHPVADRLDRLGCRGRDGLPQRLQRRSLVGRQGGQGGIDPGAGGVRVWHAVPPSGIRGR